MFFRPGFGWHSQVARAAAASRFRRSTLRTLWSRRDPERRRLGDRSYCESAAGARNERGVSCIVLHPLSSGPPSQATTRATLRERHEMFSSWFGGEKAEDAAPAIAPGYAHPPAAHRRPRAALARSSPVARKKHSRRLTFEGVALANTPVRGKVGAAGTVSCRHSSLPSMADPRGGPLTVPLPAHVPSDRYSMSIPTPRTGGTLSTSSTRASDLTVRNPSRLLCHGRRTRTAGFLLLTHQSSPSVSVTTVDAGLTREWLAGRSHPSPGRGDPRGDLPVRRSQGYPPALPRRAQVQGESAL